MKTISPNHYNPCCTYTQNINSISHNLLKSLIRTLAIGSSDLLAAVSELKHFAALREGAPEIVTNLDASCIYIYNASDFSWLSCRTSPIKHEEKVWNL